jgi:zinc transporter 9
MAIRNTSGFLPVVMALGGNVLVTAAKYAAAILSGSSAMFSEAIHSTADTLNQIFLLIGLSRSQKKADDSFEYGYGNERFFWALISACGIFFAGAGVTAYQGITMLLHPHGIEFSIWIFPVLFFSFCVEFYTFRVAARSLKKSFPDAGWLERLSLSDPMTLAVFLEDLVAVGGVMIAAIAVALSYYTGNVFWDALGSLVIAAFLGLVAIILIIKNRAYLIGRAMPAEMEEDVIAMLQSEPAIEKVIDFKSSVVGWGIYRIKCEVEFNGGALIRQASGRASMRKQFDEIGEDFEEFKRFVADYTDRIPRLMGRKIDDIEKRIRAKYPGIRHIDIEVN